MDDDDAVNVVHVVVNGVNVVNGDGVVDDDSTCESRPIDSNGSNCCSTATAPVWSCAAPDPESRSQSAQSTDSPGTPYSTFATNWSIACSRGTSR